MKVLTKHDDGQISVILTDEEFKVLEDICGDIYEYSLDNARDNLKDAMDGSYKDKDISETIDYAMEAVRHYRQYWFASEFKHMCDEEGL